MVVVVVVVVVVDAMSKILLPFLLPVPRDNARCRQEDGWESKCRSGFPVPVPVPLMMMWHCLRNTEVFYWKAC